MPYEQSRDPIRERHENLPRQRRAQIVLDRASFTLKQGICYGILGINGAGKSTTMRILAGTEEPTKGKVYRGRRVSWPLGFAGGFHPR